MHTTRLLLLDYGTSHSHCFSVTQPALCTQGVPPAVLPEQLPQLLDVSAPFRDAFLSSGLVRLQEAVGTAFPGSSRALPSPADVQKCIG
jgi:hypothetical protein